MTESRVSSPLRSRLQLLLIAGLFFGSFAVAAVLFFSGWTPTSTRNLGTMLDPYPELGTLALQHADGRAYDWQPTQRHWRILVQAPTGCGEGCTQLLNALHRVWYSEGRHAERLEVLWFGELPLSAPQFSGLKPMRATDLLDARLPQASRPGAVPAYLVDPSGYVVLHYAPGFNPAELRKDLGRLLK